MSTPAGFRCTFDRIGQNRNVPPLDVNGITEADDDALLDAVLRYADPRLGSSDVEVMVNAEEMRGLIVVGGWRPGGCFTIAPICAACCDLHRPGACCDPEDCAPCCPDCPECPIPRESRPPLALPAKDEFRDAPRQYCVDNHKSTGKVEATHRNRYASTPVCDRPECQEVAHDWVQSMAGRRGAFIPYGQDPAAQAGGQR